MFLDHLTSAYRDTNFFQRQLSKIIREFFYWYSYKKEILTLLTRWASLTQSAKYWWKLTRASERELGNLNFSASERARARWLQIFGERALDASASASELVRPHFSFYKWGIISSSEGVLRGKGKTPRASLSVTSFEWLLEKRFLFSNPLALPKYFSSRLNDHSYQLSIKILWFKCK